MTDSAVVDRESSDNFMSARVFIMISDLCMANWQFSRSEVVFGSIPAAKRPV
jgi:hypothetical protein